MKSSLIRLMAGLFFATAPVALQSQVAPAAEGSFALHDGDRVTFYGDSITEQRQYTEDVEEFVLTRFPQWKLDFHNAGVGGDKVSGGHAGPVDLRLDRDVFPWQPSVITIMLGMNDGYYRANEPGIYETYTEGYQHIVERMQKQIPTARMMLIQPSAYDDITRPPMFSGGYNSVLLTYSSFLADLARDRRTQLTDFNTPLTTILTTLNRQSPNLAPQLIPDRIHPQQAGHWIMAEALLKSWGATPLISDVSIDAGGKSSGEGKNVQISEVRKIKDKAGDHLAWTETEHSLPLPFPPESLDPVLGLVMKNSDLVTALDQEMLHVRGLATGTYELLIDGRSIGTFNSDELAQGVNLATLPTPMLEQSLLVAMDTQKKNNLEQARFDIVQKSLADESSPVAQALASAMAPAVAQQRADAQPKSHSFELRPGVMAPAPKR